MKRLASVLVTIAMVVGGILFLQNQPVLVAEVAVNTVDHASTASYPSSLSRGDCWAIIVGVADYQHYDPWEGDLHYTDDSAREFYDVLRSAWGENHVKLLLNAEATKAAIQSAISVWLDPLDDSDDTVVFYFAGHGSQADFDQPPYDEADGKDETICPYDTSSSSWSYDIFDDELSSWLGNLESVKQVVVLDSCHSGGFIDMDGATGLRAPLDGRIDGLVMDLTKSGRVILAGCGENEIGWEAVELGHAVFSHYVLESLETPRVVDTDSDGEISAEEVFNYAQPRTSGYESAHDYDSVQHPVMYDGCEGPLSLFSLATLTIDTNPRALPVTVDGEVHSASESPVSVYFIAGVNRTFTFSVPALVDAGVQQPKYTFRSWNDNVTSNSRTATISESASYVADYGTQCYLAMQSERGNPQGSGWYSQGAIAQFSLDCLINENGGIRYVFDGWSGASTGTDNPSSVVMDSPKTITAVWKSQYRLTVSTTPSGLATPSGEGWYDKGTTATIGAADAIEESAGVRHVFSSWSVDGKRVAGNPISVEMEALHNTTALYTTQYELTVLSDRGETQGSGWYNAGSEAAISVESSSGVIIRRVFAGWMGDSSATARDAAVLMDGPKTVEARWRTDYTQLYILVAGVLVVAGIVTAVVLLRRKGHGWRDLPDYLSDRFE